jgi:hypothetical protein
LEHVKGFIRVLKWCSAAVRYRSTHYRRFGLEQFHVKVLAGSYSFVELFLKAA